MEENRDFPIGGNTTFDTEETSAIDGNFPTSGRASPRTGPIRLAIRRVSGFTIVDLANDQQIVDDQFIDQLGEKLQQLVENGHDRLLLNLHGLSHASSTILVNLAWLNRKVTERRGLLRLYGLDPVLSHALRVCRLDRIFEVFDDLDSAMSAGIRPRDRTRY